MSFSLMNFKISLTVISFEIFCFDSFAILINMILNYNKFKLLLVINTFSFQTIKKNVQVDYDYKNWKF